MVKNKASLLLRNKTLLPLIIICVISFFVLSYKISQVPNGVYLDEATTGYNAYSILKTGKDEYGKDFPLAFRFFGSYTPPLYTYFTVIPIYIFGLNEFSVRIISVTLGALFILVLYGFLKQSNLINKRIIYFLLLLFIITPWNFFFARTGYEIYLGFALFYLGVLYIWSGIRRKLFFIPGLIILSLATYGAHAQIYSVPLFIIGFIAMFGKQLNKKILIAGIICALIIQVPHISLLGTQAFLNKSDLFYTEEVFLNSDKIFLPKLISIPISFGYSFFSRVVAFISPHSLFFMSDPDPQRSIPEISVLYSWMVVPFLIGLFVLFKNFKDDFSKLILLLLLVSIIPPSLTKDPFSTQRGLSLLLPLFLIISFGLSNIHQKIKNKAFITGFALIFLISLITLWRSYFVLLPAERAVNWNYGFNDIAKFISENPRKSFVIEQIHGKPVYIELAFFLKTNPEVLQNSVNPNIKTNYYDFNQFNPDYKFENLQTRKIKWEEDVYKDQILIGDALVVSETQAKEHFLSEVFLIKDSRGYSLYKAFLTNPVAKCEATANKSEHCLLVSRKAK